ncbi:hypothetical protein L1887_54053 [Cichorium endivia]|nr:hypothetical protein L1887_54053 [Cichorium endivia]
MKGGLQVGDDEEEEEEEEREEAWVGGRWVAELDRAFGLGSAVSLSLSLSLALSLCPAVGTLICLSALKTRRCSLALFREFGRWTPDLGISSTCCWARQQLWLGRLPAIAAE